MALTTEQYIQYLRTVVTTARIDELTDSQLRRLQRSYSEATSELFGALQNAPELAKKGLDPRAIEKRIRQLQQQSDLTEIISNRFTDLTVAAGGIAYPSYNSLLSWDGQVPINEVVMAADELRERVQAAKFGGETIEGLVQSVFDNAVDPQAVADVIETARIQGRGTRYIVDRLKREYNDKTRDELTTIARSYTQAMNVQAQTDVYKANHEMVPNVQWIATLENGDTTTGRGTCPRCAALDGQKFPLSEVDSGLMPPIPLHPRCRCVLVPLTPTWKELGLDIDEQRDLYRPWVIRTEDAIADGGRREIIIAGRTGTNYSRWWRDQDPLIQDAAIGRVRANLVRGGAVKFEKLVDRRTGELIPIAELNVDPEALRRAWSRGGSGGAAARAAGFVGDPQPDGSGNWYDALGFAGLSHDWIKKASGSMTPGQRELLERTVQTTGHEVKVVSVSQANGYFSPGHNHINMPNASLQSHRGRNTYWHEFGHYLDWNMNNQIRNAHKGESVVGYGRWISGHSVWHNAMIGDNDMMRKWQREDFKTLGGTGRFSRQRLLERRMAERSLISEEFGDLFDEGSTRKLEGWLDKNASGHIKSLYDKSKETRLMGGDSQEPSYRRQLRELVISQRTGTKSNLADDWLGAARNYRAEMDGDPIGYMSDLISATTKNRYGSGHSDHYYNRNAENRNVQSFANMLLLWENEGARGFLEFFTPRQFKAFKDLIDKMGK